MRAFALFLLTIVAAFGAQQPNPFAASDNQLRDGWTCLRTQAGKYYVGTYDTKTGHLLVYYPADKVIDFSHGGVAKVMSTRIEHERGCLDMLGPVERLAMPEGYGPPGYGIDRPMLPAILARDKPLLAAAQHYVDLKARRDALMVGDAETRNHAAIDALDKQITEAENRAGELFDAYNGAVGRMVNTVSMMIELKCGVNDCQPSDSVKKAIDQPKQ
jgi:hypothetical protein